MTDDDTKEKPAKVPERAKQGGEIRDRWPWVESCVWTERMLTALENGVKGGKWFALMDKVYAPRNLHRAFEKVRENQGSAGVDHVTVDRFGERLEEEIDALSRSLREKRFRPQRIRRVWIPKPGSSEKRPLGIPTVRDRVVQTALRNVLEPIFERDFAPHSYGFRPGRGCKEALRRVEELLKAGNVYVVDADLKGYFDSIPREPLMDRMREKVADGRILELLEQYLSQEILEDLAVWTPERGTPQGAVISPLLANVYLDPLDHRMAARGDEMVRYADDFVILCPSESEARRALQAVREWTAAVGLALHPTKTHVVDARLPGGFDFLGYHFERGTRWPRKKSLKKLQDTLRGKTRRTCGRSLDATIEDVNRTLCGWFEYFKHSRPLTFDIVDGWVRMRLRSILRKRQRRKGPGRGFDHLRWPKAFFEKHGLFSLSTAHAALRQSSRR